MLASLFSALCAGEVPIAPDCWEVSRLLTSPTSARGTSVLKVHRLLALAMVEFAALNHIRRYTLVTEPHRVPALLSVGWTVRPLGLPARHFGQELQALEILITPRTLAAMRDKSRMRNPVLRAKGLAGYVA
jgi:acyl-homoserine lactone synthase